MTDKTHMDYLHVVANEDIAVLTEKERTYAGSWKKRGGVGAFMMLARKWDRLESILSQSSGAKTRGVGVGHTRRAETVQYDIFSWIDTEQDEQGADGTVLAEVRDLRRYLMLCEAEMMARRVVAAAAIEGLTRVMRDADMSASNPGGWDKTDRVRFRYEIPVHTVGEPAPVPLTDGNKHAERSAFAPPQELNYYELQQLPANQRVQYEWNAERNCYRRKVDL